jgi:hypothetical protein
MSNLQASKSILAKLMATENITVSHQNVQTAYFDLKSRTIILPVWKEMDGDLYDLLTGHEVGHALDTPEQGWHSALDNTEKSERKKYKDFLNVIEDARIERRQKRRYPGLGKSFANAYKSLYDRDFFGIKKLGDLDKLNLIDRINLYYKLGAHVVVKFTDAERDYLREIDNAETWEQVEDIAKRIYGYVKENEKDKIQNQNDLDDATKPEPMPSDGEDDGEDEEENEIFDEDFDDSESSDESMDGDGFNDETENNEEDAEETQDQETESKEKSAGEDDDGEPKSVTDRSFRQKEQELINASGEVHMLNLPEADLSQIILDNTEVMNDLELFIRKQVQDQFKIYARNKISFETLSQKCVAKFNKNNKKYIMHILKEFEMRKKASEYARTTTARTGELNMNVLHKYKFSNDLFKKINVVPKGKSHGLIMYVDMSGSMSDIFRNTIEQALVLASFCKMANIPFDIYGFSDDYYHNRKLMTFTKKFISDSKTEMHIGNTAFHLKHLLGSKLGGVQYRRAFNLLAITANEYGRSSYHYYDDTNKDNDHGNFDYNWENAGFSLNGTPFLQTLLASREMIKKFQNAHQLDIVNVLYLTDGVGGNDMSYPFDPDKRNSLNFWKGVTYFIDKKSGKKVRVEGNHGWQSAITKLVADVTGCKHLGFYLGSDREIRQIIRQETYNMTTEESREILKSYRSENFFACSSLGYSKYFYVRSSRKSIVDEELAVTPDMTKSKMASAFNKMQQGKKNSRLLVSKFAEELAVA